MPRFYFHLRRGPGPDKLTLDPEGDDLTSGDAVRPHAFDIIRGMLRTRSHVVRDWMVCSLEVRDEAQRLVVTIPFGDIVPDSDADGGR